MCFLVVPLFGCLSFTVQEEEDVTAEFDTKKLLFCGYLKSELEMFICEMIFGC